MFASTFTVATLALSMVGSASAIHIPRKAAPAGWWAEGLENYDVYHTRYLALSCQTQHNTDFFDLCCHPMLNTENLTDNRDASCTPSTAASSSASAAEPTSTIDTGNEGFDNSDDTSNDDSSSDNNDDEEYDDDDEWECDDDEESSSADAPAPTTSTKEDKPTSTKEAEPTSTEEAEPTSTKEAKPTTTSEAEPTTTKEAKPTTTSEAEPTSSSGGDSGGSGAYPGTITFYDQGGVAGACGDFHSDNDDIAAVAFDMYGDIGSKSGLCGQKIKITNEANGQSVTVTIADACEGCKDTQFDLSTGAFNKIADANLGLVDVTIQWL